MLLIPGFSAENSLYRTSNSFRVANRSGSGVSRDVIVAQLVPDRFLRPQSYCYPCFHGAQICFTRSLTPRGDLFGYHVKTCIDHVLAYWEPTPGVPQHGTVRVQGYAYPGSLVTIQVVDCDRSLQSQSSFAAPNGSFNISVLNCTCDVHATPIRDNSHVNVSDNWGNSTFAIVSKLPCM
jgi:hypothetical protein